MQSLMLSAVAVLDYLILIPIGSFLFLGPTGVGKTELCKALANFLFDMMMQWFVSICLNLWKNTPFLV